MICQSTLNFDNPSIYMLSYAETFLCFFYDSTLNKFVYIVCFFPECCGREGAVLAVHLVGGQLQARVHAKTRKYFITRVFFYTCDRVRVSSRVLRQESIPKLESILLQEFFLYMWQGLGQFLSS